MHKQLLAALMLAGLAGIGAPAPVSAQQAAPPVAPAPQAPPPAEPTQAPAQAPLPPDALTRSVCGNPLPAPTATPPAGTTFIWYWEPCFPTQGETGSNIETETYLYYVRFPSLVSRPSEGVWSPWTEQAREVAVSDFKRLMNETTFLDDLRIEVNDFTFPNGAVGKIVSYIMEERERVKIVDYRDGKGEPIEIIKRSDIDEKLREKDIIVRLDSFVDPTMIRRVETVLDELMTEKGFANSRISHTLTPVAGGPKLVNVTFIVAEGPKDKISRVEFTGNTAVSDGKLRKQLKENKPKGSFFTLGFLKGGGTWKETAFEEDAARVVDYYQREGYAKARVGAPELRVLRESEDGSERHVELRIPVTEGPRYRMGELTFDGNKVVRPDYLRELYKMKPGEWYSRKDLYDGFRTTQQVYGQLGYMEWTPAPMFKYSDDPDPIEQAITALVPPMILAPGDPKTGGKQPDPVVDVNVLFQEGPQYFVNRITFTGNTTTRDNVIRREMRLYEGNVFDTEALKFSVRRLNQLGYFSEIYGDERDTKIDKTPDRPNTVDITMRLAEQNRNQLTFGAGVSQYEGVFGQLAFQTSNFLGRGESLTLQMTAGDRSQNYQVAFTEPYLFDRNITGGFDFFKRSLDYIGYYTQKSAGGNLIFGFPVANFSRMFFNYAYESVKIENLNEALIDQSCLLRVTGCGTIQSVGDLSQLTSTQREILARNPFVLESLLLGQGGSRTISKVVPSFVHNTVDNPIFPNQGKKLTASIDLALLGGNTKYYKPRLEGIFFKRHLPRTSVGFRVLGEYISSVGSAPCVEDPTRTCSRTLPIFERLTLGGEYSIRGLDLRSVGPTIKDSVAVLGGNKSLLFNAEYLISLASQVRIVLFYDAGQVRDVGQSFTWKEDVTELVFPDPPLLSDALAVSSLTDPNAPGVTTRVTGRASAFKTSTGVELRFFMPVLNVPFRLIYAWNPQRAGVLDNSLRPQKEQIFKFSVGTTF